MSRFLKFIVHTVVVLAVLCVAAIMAPPFFGITTVVMDDPDARTNLPMGSVTYAIPVKTEEVAVGTRILVEEDSKTYRYNIISLDVENHTGIVADPTISGAETLTVAVKNYVPKIVVTIGLIGYLQVATKSMEGLIIIGLAILFLIILYVIAELWRKEPEEEEEDEVYVKSEKELRREEKEREKRMKEEDRKLLKEAKEKRKKDRKSKQIIKTGGFVDEVFEDDFEPEEEDESSAAKAQEAASEAHELLKKEIAATTAEENSDKETSYKKNSKPRTQSEEPKKTVRMKKMVLPKYSVEQLAAKAEKAGDSPEILKDDITNVTLFDYSDIIGGEED